MAETTPSQEKLLQTPLHDLHVRLGAEMVPFAGYAMPVRYPAGILKEHLHTRAAAGLFDVSHMGQVLLSGFDAAQALETLVPGDIAGLTEGRMRYTLFTNEKGGVLDDLMVTRRPDDLYLVVNAACKHDDLAHLQNNLSGLTITPQFDRALMALQGPQAAEVLSGLNQAAGELKFMSGAAMVLDGLEAFVTRSGYTGEDGFEISVAAEDAVALAERLLAHEAVAPVGLGARDSLRLEAGLCLYGADLTPDITPVEASLTWTIGKRRKMEKGFPGADIIMDQVFDGPQRLRVGILPAGRAPARAHTDIVDPKTPDAVVGEITSGGFGPSVGGPVAMGYVPRAMAEDGTELGLVVRGKVLPAKVVPLPFVKKSWK